MPTFYKTTITIDVLSEEPLGEFLTLSQIDYAISEGDCVGYNLESSQVELTPADAAKALIAAGSEPGFFFLNDDGTEIDSDRDERHV